MREQENNNFLYLKSPMNNEVQILVPDARISQPKARNNNVSLCRTLYRIWKSDHQLKG